MPLSIAQSKAVPLRSVTQILAAMLCFALVDALAKSLSLRYPANEVTFFRMIFGLLPAFAMSLQGSKPMTQRLMNLDIKAQTLRAITLLCALGLFFAGLPYVPLSEAVAIVYSETMFVIVLAPLMLKETLRRRDAGAAAIGFVGVLLVVRPGSDQTSWLGPVLLVLSAIFGALSILQIKRLRASDDSSVTVLYFTMIGAIVSGFSLMFAWEPPTLDSLAILALVGVLAGTGQLLMTMAFRQADASALAPFNYTSIVWAAIFGYVAWGETVGMVSLVGILLIVGSSILVAIRRNQADGPIV